MLWSSQLQLRYCGCRCVGWWLLKVKINLNFYGMPGRNAIRGICF